MDIRTFPIVPSGTIIFTPLFNARFKAPGTLLNRARHISTVSRQASFLRWLFVPDSAVALKANSEASKLGEASSLLIAVHIRRGDFKEWNGGKYYFDLDYYKPVMESTIQVFQGRSVNFVIFSDDPQLDLSFLSGILHVRLLNMSSLSFDWYFMSLCDFIISSLYSTYSGWASFFGAKSIFCLNGERLPEKTSDFFFEPVLNNSCEYNQTFEAASRIGQVG